MILTPEDLERAIIAPVIVPRVGHQPVGRALLHAPSEDADRVASQSRALHMLINARLVIGKVGVDGERRLHGAVVHQLDLDLVLIVVDGVAAGAECLVLVVGHVVAAVLALAVAVGGGAALLAGAAGSFGVVLARLDLVRLAAFVGAVHTLIKKTKISYTNASNGKWKEKRWKNVEKRGQFSF